MKPCVWYDVDEKLPPAKGYYLAYKGLSMGDDEQGCDYYYWDARRAEWRDSQISSAYHVNVIYWTEADPSGWLHPCALPHISCFLRPLKRHGFLTDIL